MISVVIPTLNAQTTLGACLTSLVAGIVEGCLREVIICDGGSIDHTEQIAEQAGAVFLQTPCGRGQQLRQGASQAKSDWLLFLHADTVLEVGWERDVAAFIEAAHTRASEMAMHQTIATADPSANAPGPVGAAAFRFALDDAGIKPRVLEGLVALRSSILRMPYGDQGLLIHKSLYEQIGGYQPLPLMEDVDLVRRVPRGMMTILRTKAVTSAVRFRRDGYVKRSSRNLICLGLYYLKVPSHYIARFYGT